MSSGNTETRILQMQLENKDFEEGVRQTIKSLESLEEKLNLKNAGDGFEKVSAAANSVQMTHLESGLDAVTNKFTLMGQIGLQVLERISSKVVDTGEKILRAATIQPMIDGWGEFEMKTGSIQTILGGIRNQFEDQPTAINAISKALDELNEYADKTIYNFAQMTENVGKFTNQGISLKDSTNAIKGIANWAAAVGANPQQMSRAMYNISQSLGAGSMQLIDWRSIRFANMATPEVKKLFVEVAKVQDDMLDDEGNIKIGKQTLNALKDFESSLKGGWLTNEVMAEAFSIYANAYSETELIEKYGEELGRTFYEMGVYAEEAATKVRTFSQLIGVLKESLGSGWASTFDILFGGFEQQTEFFTAIKERIEDIINFQTEDRNTWLQNFSDIGGIKVFQDVILGTIDILSDFYWVFNDVAALVLNPFGQSVFNMSDGIFGPRQEGYTEMQKTWEGVKGIFDDISNSLSNFRRWMYTPNEKTGRSPIHNLANALSGVAGAAGIAAQVLGGFSKLVTRLFKRFEPLVSSVLDLLGQIGGAIYNVFFNLTGQQSIEKVFDKIGDAIEPVIDFVVGLASAIVDLIHSFLGIDEAADDWTVLAERMQAFWDIFTYNQDLTFIDNLKNSLKKAFTSLFGSDVADSLIQGWDENVAPVLEQISGFFTQAGEDIKKSWAKLYEYLFGHEITGKMGNTWREGGAINEVLDFFSSETWQSDWAIIQGAFESISNWVTTTGEAAWKTIMDFLFGPETTVMTGPGQSFTHRTGGAYLEALRFLTPVWEWIDSTGRQLLDFVTKNDFKQMWKSLNDLLFGYDAEVMKDGRWQQGHIDGVLTPIVDMLTPISEAFANAKAWGLEKLSGIDWSGIWESVRKFFMGYDTAVFDQSGRNIATEHHEGAFERIIGFFERIINYFEGPEFQAFFANVKTFYHTYIEPVFNWIGGLGSELWGAIQGLFSGQGLGAFSGVGTYLMGGFDKLISKIFPEGFDLSGIFGGLFGGEGSLLDKLFGGNKDVNKAVDQAASDGQGGFLDQILGLFMGSAGAEESEISAASENYINLLESKKNDVEETADKGTGIMDSILGSVSKFLPYIGAAGGIALVGKVGDMITGITGNRKPTIIEQIAGLFRALGEPLKGLGIAIAATGFAEAISPGAIDKVFGHIQSILTTVFGWVAGIAGGGMLAGAGLNLLGNWGLNKLTGSSKGFSFDKVTDILSGIGQGISGLFDGLQNLFSLTWEVMGADILMGAENFDKRIDRVLSFTGKIIDAVLRNGAWLEAMNLVNTGAAGAAQKFLSADVATESLASMMAGLGTLISGVGDGIAALMTASIVPGIMNVDISAISDLVNTVFTGLDWLIGIKEFSSLGTKIITALDPKAGWMSVLVQAVEDGLFVTFLGGIGLVAGALADWYLTIAEQHMVAMGPTIYNFISNLTGALEALSSIGDTNLEMSQSLFETDLPKLFAAITSEDLGFDKEAMDGFGTTIRDFGNRIYNGINTLAKAKGIFDKYNDGGGFPLEFFQEMTEALQYLSGDDISELYDNVFGQNGFWVGDTGNDKPDIDGLNSFFKTMGSLGSVITEYNEVSVYGINKFGTKLSSAKEGLDAFQDAFSSVQATFHAIVGDITTEGFSIEKVNTITDLIGKISEAGNTFVKSFYFENGLLKMYEQTGPITQFSGFIQALGTALHDMAGAVVPEDEGNLAIASGAIGSLYTALQTMPLEQLGGYASAFEALKQSLLIPEGANTMASVIQGIAGAAGANGVQLRIVPVVDGSGFGGSWPGGMSMENTYSRMIAMQMSMNDVQNVRVDASQIGSLVTANNQTRDRIESLASAIRQIKISINLPSTGYGPRSRNVEVYPLVANYQSPYGP